MSSLYVYILFRYFLLIANIWKPHTFGEDLILLSAISEMVATVLLCASEHVVLVVPLLFKATPYKVKLRSHCFKSFLNRNLAAS